MEAKRSTPNKKALDGSGFIKIHFDCDEDTISEENVENQWKPHIIIKNLFFRIFFQLDENHQNRFLYDKIN